MMDALNFAYWLNGFAELSGDTPPTAEQWKAIREHLGLVFQKVTPAVRYPNQPLPSWKPGDVAIPLTPGSPRYGEAPWWLSQVQCSADAISITKAQATC